MPESGHSGEQVVDVAVIGGGFAGLMTADRLTTLGYRVAVIERAPRLLAGTSSRNEGWLHAGTYHAVSIADRLEAAAVARRCVAGWREYRTRFPHAVMHEDHRAVAMVPHHRVEEVESRWRDSGVAFAALSREHLHERDPHVVLTADERTYEVADVGIDTRMVAASLVQQLRSRGAQILVDVHAERTGPDRLTLRGPTADLTVRFRFLVVAAGYSMEQATGDLGLDPVEVRLWRSHLLTAPRAAALSVFSVSPGDASMMNHGGWSIIGLNEDATVVEAPTTEPDPAVSSRLAEAVLRRFPRVDMSQANVRACVKVDYARTANDPRSLNVRVLPVAGHAAAVLPGKMTEAPVVADSVAHVVFQALGSPDVSDRPVDSLLTGACLG